MTLSHPLPVPSKWKIPRAIARSVFGFVVVAGILFAGIRVMLVDTPAHTEALARARANPLIQAALGTPITEDRWVTGSVNYRNGEGTTTVKSTLRGPRGHGTLLERATKDATGWHQEVLKFRADGDTTIIDLIRPGEGPQNSVEIEFH